MPGAVPDRKGNEMVSYEIQNNATTKAWKDDSRPWLLVARQSNGGGIVVGRYTTEKGARAAMRRRIA